MFLSLNKSIHTWLKSLTNPLLKVIWLNFLKACPVGEKAIMTNRIKRRASKLGCSISRCAQIQIKRKWKGSLHGIVFNSENCFWCVLQTLSLCVLRGLIMQLLKLDFFSTEFWVLHKCPRPEDCKHVWIVRAFPPAALLGWACVNRTGCHFRSWCRRVNLYNFSLPRVFCNSK